MALATELYEAWLVADRAAFTAWRASHVVRKEAAFLDKKADEAFGAWKEAKRNEEAVAMEGDAQP